VHAALNCYLHLLCEPQATAAACVYALVMAASTSCPLFISCIVHEIHLDIVNICLEYLLPKFIIHRHLQCWRTTLTSCRR
jgi:hypothetical protein